jgi:hypothetical protein
MNIVKVKDIEPGQVVRFVDGTELNPVLSDRVFRIGLSANHSTGHVYAYARFTNQRVTLHPNGRVVVDNSYVDDDGRWI